MPAAAEGLQMLLRGDRDLLDRVMRAADPYRTLEASPEDLAVIKLVTKALPSALEKFVLCDSSSHTYKSMGKVMVPRSPFTGRHRSAKPNPSASRSD